MALRMDDSRSVEIDPAKHRHLDHGYAVTSHSSQGQTADRVLIHVDRDLVAKDLLYNRMGYVAVSRGAHDAQLFINDQNGLNAALERGVSHRSAHLPKLVKEVTQPQQEIAPNMEHGYGLGLSLRAWLCVFHSGVTCHPYSDAVGSVLFELTMQRPG